MNNTIQILLKINMVIAIVVAIRVVYDMILEEHHRLEVYYAVLIKLYSTWKPALLTEVHFIYFNI